MSDTPRTDAARNYRADVVARNARLIDLAETLERELAAEQERATKAEKLWFEHSSAREDLQRLVTSQGIRLMATEDCIEKARQWVRATLGSAHLKEMDEFIKEDE